MEYRSRLSRFIGYTAASRFARHHSWILAGLAALYLVTFPIFKAPILVVLPVVVAGWFYYSRGAVIASVMALLVDLALHRAFVGGLDWDSLLSAQNGFMFGHVLVLFVSTGVGYLRGEIENHARIDSQLHSRERFLTLINQATSEILEMRNPAGAYEHIITHLASFLEADHAYMIRWDDELQQSALATVLPARDQPLSGLTLNLEQIIAVKEFLQTRHVLAIEDVQKSPQAVYPTRVEELLTRAQSALVIPLITKEYQFGTAVLGFNSPRTFSAEQTTLIEVAGSQIALAFRSIKQEHRIEKQLKEANTFARIERALIENQRMGLDSVLNLIVDAARELIPIAKFSVLHLLDEEHKLLVPRAVSGFTEEPRSNLNMHLGEGIAGLVLSKGDTVAIPDVRVDARFLSQTLPANYRSIIVAPVISNSGHMGTISVHSDEVGVFTPGEINLLGSLGRKAAIAIENASLLETTLQDFKEVNALYHITRNLSISLYPDQLMKDAVEFLMKDAVEFLQHVFEFYHIQIYLVDPSSGNLAARYGAGAAGNRLAEQGYFLSAGSGIPGHVAETGEPFFTNDVERVIFFKHNPSLPDTRSEMVLPIKTEKGMLGVLDIHQTASTLINSRQMKLMDAAAQQLAIALQRAELYAELQNSLNTEKVMRSKLIQSERLALAGQLLASVSHELNNPLQAIQNALFLLKEEKRISEQGNQDLEIVLSETDRMASILNRLRSTYRPIQTEELEDAQINDLIENTYALTATLFRHKEIAFEFSPDPELPPVPCVPDQIKQVMLNLIMNAVDAMPTGGRLAVRTQNMPEQDQVLISVMDNGVGIDPDSLTQIFEPFVTNKSTGTGIGLTITRDIIHQHRGEIQAENNPQGGATFKVWLPAGRKV